MKQYAISLASLAIASGASAGIVDTIAFTNFSAWANEGPKLASFPAGWGTEIEVETFDFVKPGSYASLSGGDSWNSWMMSASSGSMSADGAMVSASKPGGGLTFNFAAPLDGLGSGLHGIGGDFGLRGATGGWMPGRIILTLSSGVSLTHDVNSDNPFAGFWITTPSVTITSLTVMPYGDDADTTSVSINNLYLGFAGVPAPGALALLGTAGLVSTRRRR